MKTENYNLIEEDWIPVLMKDGVSRRVSLGELFANGDQIADLSLNPYERVAIMRLLICIAMAALDEDDLRDEAAWRVCLPKIKPAVAAYFAKWHDRFNFYGDHAFMQPDDLTVKKESDRCCLAKLFPHLASGNNGTLFDHGHVVPEDDIPIGMLVYLNYSAGGQHPKCLWGGVETSVSVTAGPSREKSMMQIYAGGECLLQGLWMNLVTASMIESLPQPVRGRPLWEMEGLCRQSFAEGIQCDTVLGRMVPLSRVMKFSRGRDDFPLGEGLKFASLPVVRECMASVVFKDNKGNLEPTYVSLSESERPWRCLHAILSMKEKCGSVVLRHLNEVREGTFSIWCGGLIANQAKDEAVVEWSFTGGASLLRDVALASYAKGVQFAKLVSDKVLYGMAKEYAVCMKIDGAETILTPTRHIFWGVLERQQPLLIDVASGLMEMETWKKKVLEVARKTFESSCPHQTGRQVEAYVKALKKLYLPSDEGDKVKAQKGKKNVK